MKFTKASVASLTLPPGKTDHFEWDDSTPGFGVRLRDGRKVWYAQLRVHGRTKRMALGDVARIDLEPARAAARKFFAEATLGRDPLKARADARAKAAIAVGGTIDKFITAKEPGSRANTRRHRERFLKRFLPATLRNMAVDSVTRRDIAVALGDVARDHGVISASHTRTALNTFYAWAVKEGYAESNPVVDTNDPAPPRPPRDRTLKPREIKAIQLTLPNNNYGKVVRLLFYTACRRSEIAGLEWSEIDFDKALLTIPGSKMKGKREHRLPLVPEAIEILRTIPHQPDSPFVFGGPRGFTTFSFYGDALNKCLAATGDVTERWTLHDIRRTVRSEMGELGVEPWIGEQILAHHRGGIEATYNYAKLERQMRQALQLWADRLHAIVDETESTVVALRA